jgi:predicted aspartyl protease
VRFLILLAAALLAAAPRPAAACSVDFQAKVPLQMVLNHLLVTVNINGTDVEMTLDTGAMRTLVTEETVKRLGLHLDEWRSTMMQGIGGYSRHRDAVLDSIALAGRPMRRFGSAPDLDVAVSVLGETDVNGHHIAGILGADYLSTVDIDLDVRGRTMSLYSVSGCSGAFIPWKGAFQRVPVDLARGRLVLMHARLDGNPVSAALDTGADDSVVGSVAAARGGVTPDVLSRDRAGVGTGVGANTFTIHYHRFAELRLGDGVFPNTTLLVVDLPTAPFEMLIGLDFLRTRRAWISYGTSQLFLQ